MHQTANLATYHITSYFLMDFNLLVPKAQRMVILCHPTQFGRSLPVCGLTPIKRMNQIGDGARRTTRTLDLECLRNNLLCKHFSRNILLHFKLTDEHKMSQRFKKMMNKITHPTAKRTVHYALRRSTVLIMENRMGHA